MTDTQYEPIDEPAPHPQVNKVRGEYVEGDMSEEELEVQLENSLSEGPELCSQAISDGKMSTLGWLGACAQAPVLLLVFWVLGLKDTFSGSAEYDFSKHSISIRDTDPDPDDHPAEKSGSARALCFVLPGLIYATVILWAGPTSPTLALALGVLGIMAMLAEPPAVRYTVEGVGTHVAD